MFGSGEGQNKQALPGHSCNWSKICREHFLHSANGHHQVSQLSVRELKPRIWSNKRESWLFCGIERWNAWSPVEKAIQLRFSVAWTLFQYSFEQPLQLLSESIDPQILRQQFWGARSNPKQHFGRLQAPHSAINWGQFERRMQVICEYHDDRV